MIIMFFILLFVGCDAFGVPQSIAIGGDCKTAVYTDNDHAVVLSTGSPPQAYRVDLTSNAVIAGPISLVTGSEIVCAKYDSAAGRIYAVSLSGHLYRINPVSLALDGTVHQITASEAKAVAWTSTDVFVGVRAGSGTDVTRVNKGAWTVEETVGLGSSAKRVSVCGMETVGDGIYITADGGPGRLMAFTPSEWPSPSISIFKVSIRMVFFMSVKFCFSQAVMDPLKELRLKEPTVTHVQIRELGRFSAET